MVVNEFVKVQAMEFPSAMDFFVDVYTYDMGDGLYLTGEECLKLIEWWNNGGKEEYI